MSLDTDGRDASGVPENIRLFIALPIPRVTAESAFRLLPADLPGLRRVRPELMHLTLAFLGSTPRARVDDAIAATAEAAAARAPFEIVFDAPGRFPEGGRPRVVWLGVGRGSEEVARAGRAVRAALDSRGLVYDAKPLRAHLTLARVEDGIGLAEARAIAAAVAGLRVAPMSVDVASTVLMQSVLSPRGPRYTALATSPLGGTTARHVR